MPVSRNDALADAETHRRRRSSPGRSKANTIPESTLSMKASQA